MGDNNSLGMLRLKIQRGLNLAIRDRIAQSSDPYIVFHLGNQKKKTQTKWKTTNPEWDEKLIFDVEDPNLPLRLEVLDQDWYKDDPLGHAEIDLRPIFEAGNQDLSSEPNGKVIMSVPPSPENHFAKESKIYLSHRNLMQDMVIRLQDVETGEIEMQLTWGKN